MNTDVPAQPSAQEPDEFHGQGGEYQIDENGKRRLVSRTKPPAAVPSTEEKE